MLSQIFRRLNPRLRKRSRLRAMIRGYAHLKKKKNTGLERRIKSELADKPLHGIASSASPIIFGAAITRAELVVRQYLLQYHVGRAMIRAVLYALACNSAVVFALPASWQQSLAGHVPNVNTHGCSVAWRWSLLLRFFRNLVNMISTFSRILAVQSRPLPMERYAYFVGLSKGNLPKAGCLSGNSYDICNWYARWSGRNKNISAIKHSVSQASPAARGIPVESVEEPYLHLRGTINILRLFVWCWLAALKSIIGLFAGKWWHAILIAEAMRAKAVSMCSKETLAEEYLFHFSGDLYRPLWSYEAEKKGSRIICYFYSTFEQPKLASGYESQKFEWGCPTWPLYLVWDEYQKAQLRRDVGVEAEICIVGPICFSSGTKKIEIAGKTVAVFDVEPHRAASHFPISTLGDYHFQSANINEHFLRDVQKTLYEYGINMAFKRKRNLGKFGNKSYKKLILEISSAKNVFMVDHEASAFELTERCSGAISMPFTSAAMCVLNSKIPSVYYDPSGWIQRDDRAAHGIPILSGLNELRLWLSSLLSEDKLAI
jgi:polysaccharide biosynthesis PFTS motif protein